MEQPETIGQLSGEKAFCTCCGLELTDKEPEQIFFDGFLFEWFGYFFCTESCRDTYVDSK